MRLEVCQTIVPTCASPALKRSRNETGSGFQFKRFTLSERIERKTERQKSDILAAMTSQTTAASPVAFQINTSDNVATLLVPAQLGPVTIRGPVEEKHIIAREAIEHGHKIAITSIAIGGNIIKFGAVIGIATREIQQGDWVHLHNCGSLLDERSKAFDVHTGVPEDVTYE